MGHRVGADLPRDFDLALGDQRPGYRGAKQIGAFIKRVGPEHWKDEIAHEFFAQIIDKDLRGAQQFCFPPRRLQFFALAEIGGEGDDFAAIGLLKPAQYDGGVEPARIGKHYFSDRLCHHPSPSPKLLLAWG